MRTFIEKHLLGLLLLLALVAYLVWQHMAETKQTKEGEVADIRQQINSGIGATGLDLKTLVRNIPVPAGFDGRPAARTIHDAHGYLNDDEAAVFAVLQNKSIGQLAGIVQSFKALYGLDLDAYLHNGSYLSEFLSQAEYEQVVGIFQAARAAAHL